MRFVEDYHGFNFQPAAGVCTGDLQYPHGHTGRPHLKSLRAWFEHYAVQRISPESILIDLLL